MSIGLKNRAFGEFELFDVSSGNLYFRLRKKFAVITPLFVACMFLLVAVVNAKGLTRGAWIVVAVVVSISFFSVIKVLLDDRKILVNVRQNKIILSGRWGKLIRKSYPLPAKASPVFSEDSDGGIDKTARTVLVSVNGFEFVFGKIQMLPKDATQADYIKFLVAQSQGSILG